MKAKSLMYIPITFSDKHTWRGIQEAGTDISFITSMITFLKLLSKGCKGQQPETAPHQIKYHYENFVNLWSYQSFGSIKSLN